MEEKTKDVETYIYKEVKYFIIKCSKCNEIKHSPWYYTVYFEFTKDFICYPCNI